MADAVSVRPARAEDSQACFAVFRHALWDLMRRIGYLEPDAPDPDVESQWPAYETLYAHLAGTFAQWWLAEDAQGRTVGYARSTQRGDMAELTEFFVAPDARVAGLGRTLLEHAFPLGLGPRRSIIATIDAPAVALYLRFGVAHQTTGVDMAATPRAVAVPAGYDVRPAGLKDVLAIERELLGGSRAADVAFMLADRPAVIVTRAGRPAAYAFLPSRRGHAGPVGARDPADLPAALAVIEQSAFEQGLPRLDLTVPLAARSAVDWLVGERGFRIDPFYCLFLADGPWAQLDRYLPFNPCLFL